MEPFADEHPAIADLDDAPLDGDALALFWKSGAKLIDRAEVRDRAIAALGPQHHDQVLTVGAANIDALCTHDFTGDAGAPLALRSLLVPAPLVGRLLVLLSLLTLTLPILLLLTLALPILLLLALLLLVLLLLVLLLLVLLLLVLLLLIPAILLLLRVDGSGQGG